MLSLPWIEHMSNEEVLTRIVMTKKLLITTRKGWLKFLGYIVKKEGLAKLMFTVCIEAMKNRGKLDKKKKEKIHWHANLLSHLATLITSVNYTTKVRMISSLACMYYTWSLRAVICDPH